MSGADDLTQLSVEATIAKAEAEGFEVIRADDKTLLLDLDTEHARAQFERVLPTVQQYFNIVEREEWASKSGNLHVKLTLKDHTGPFLRYALQAALGSDGVKETLTLVRELKECDCASLLFKPSVPVKPKPKKLVRRSVAT